MLASVPFGTWSEGSVQLDQDYSCIHARARLRNLPSSYRA